MTDTIEQKALALLREVAEYEIDSVTHDALFVDVVAALCRAIEQHEAFRQEVSDAVEDYNRGYKTFSEMFDRFIIAKPVDPLVEALRDVGHGMAPLHDQIRAAIEKRGGKIVWGEG